MTLFCLLQRHTAQLREELGKLKPPACVLEEFPDWESLPEFQDDTKPSTSSQGASQSTPKVSRKGSSSPKDEEEDKDLESIAKASVNESISKALVKADLMGSDSLIDTIVIEGESTSSASSSSILGDLSGGDEAGMY